MTKKQIGVFAALMGMDKDAAEGSLAMFCEGKGELPAAIFDSPETYAAFFKSIRDSYFKALGVDVPPLSNMGESSVSELPE